GSRQRPSGVAYGRSRFPSRSTTSVEKASPSPTGVGPSATIHQAAAAASATVTIDRAARLKRNRRRKLGGLPLPGGGGGRVRGLGSQTVGEPVTPSPGGLRPPTSPLRGEVQTERVAAQSLIALLLRRRHIDRAGRGAAEAIGPVHVLHVGLWVDVAAGRDRAHHVGDREHRRIAALALERGAEAVVAEFRARRLLRVLDPAERAGIAGGDEPRIVDLEAGREIIGDDDAGKLRLRLGDLQHDREAIV